MQSQKKEMKQYIAPTGKLSVNSMKIWIAYDADLSQQLETPEILKMISDICGVTPSASFKKRIWQSLGISGEVWTYEEFKNLMGSKGNEKTFYDLIWEADSSVRSKSPRSPGKATTPKLKGYRLKVDLGERKEPEQDNIDFGVSPRAVEEAEEFRPPTANLAKNTLKMWLRFDQNRAQKLNQKQIVTMITEIMGSTPSKRRYEVIMENWGVFNDTLTWDNFVKIYGQKANESILYSDIYHMIHGAVDLKNA